MSCYTPLRANVVDGKIQFGGHARRSHTQRLPCGQCIGCRLDHARTWAIRIMHEAQLHEDNCFITLTYANTGPSLVYRDFQLFLKKLRETVRRQDKTWGPIRFYMSGEYGDQLGRPHFHAALFNWDFIDLTWHTKSPAGFDLYSSELLSKLWGHGFCSRGALTFESAAYIARYVTKKITGEAKTKHYELIDQDTGEITSRQPEFARMSLRPGIGATWLEKYHSDVYPHGLVVANGHEQSPPRYYDKLNERRNPEQHAMMKKRRMTEAAKHWKDNTSKRLKVREQVHQARIRQLKRKTPWNT